MSENLGAASAAMGIPEALVSRAAAARAAETGASIDEILAAWAAGGDIPAPTAAAEPAAAEPEAPAEETTPEAAPPPESAPVAAAAPTTPAAASAVSHAAPTEVTPREAAHLPEVITVPTAGIRERTSASIPRWLTALMVAVPLVALLALGGGATGQCGTGTELTVDVVTGEIVDCDGTEFTGRTPGGGPGTDFIALGSQLYSGAAVTGVNCAGCHGAGGQGAGAFPAMTGVLTTFGACTDHIEWITLGTPGFQAADRATYGDTGKTVGGAGTMPGFASSLTEEQLAAVAAFERVQFAGADRDQTLIDCGLVEDEDEGEGEGEGEPDAEARTPRRPS